MIKPENLEDAKPAIADTAVELVQKITTLVCQAVNSHHSEDGNKADQVYLAAMGAIGALHVVAALCGSKELQMNERVNNVSTMFAALLAHRISPAVPANGMVMSSFGPDIIVEALDMVEKQLGHQPDGWLDAAMCKACREIVATTKIDRSNRDAHLSKHLN